MKASQLRQKYLDFFVSKGHKIIPSAPLVPEEKIELAGTQKVLFTTAGMHPLVPYLLGESHPGGKRLVNVQKCLRTDDIDEVGDKVHHTFFEMLGNWSLGDYWKKEAIEWSLEFLTDKKWLGIDKTRLAISVFAGDNDAPFDKESYDMWRNLGIPEVRIAKLPKKNNWWGPAGETGPCGPDTEMFIWSGAGAAPEKFGPDNQEWIEVWNDVFMEYNKTGEGRFESLKQKNVDTGMGLERMLAVLGGVDDDYQTDLFLPIIRIIEDISGRMYAENVRGFRIVVDHLKATIFILAEGMQPANIGQGYVLRRLIRRAIRYGKQLGINQIFIPDIADVVISLMKDVCPELERKAQFIKDQLLTEEEKFERTVGEGLRKAQKIFGQKTPIAFEKYSKIMQAEDKKEIFRKLYRGSPQAVSDFRTQVDINEIHKATISGKEAFDLYQTFGFPIEMILELAQEKKILVDIENYEEELKKHQELSRTASSGMFKGGLADQSEQTIKYHTATHLLHAALRQILGTHVQQKGSNITNERLRFDFSHPQKMTEEELKNAEDLVNQKIRENLPVTMEEVVYEEAIKSGALAFFTQKYGEKVKVYTIGTFSKEVCGGPHVDFTGKLGEFKIKKEELAAKDTRRIYATLT